MNFPNQPIFRQGIYFGAMAAAVIMLCSCDYMHRAYLRGHVVDVSGQALPGVVVRVAGTDFESLSNVLGQYSLGATTGRMQLDFFKTGYSPARLEVVVDTMGVTETPTVMLWPLPIGEGVYLFRNYRYQQTSHPRPNRYNVKELGTAFGTPVNPELVIPWVSPDSDPDANPPFMIGHKVPAYDARLHKLRKVNAALIHTGSREADAKEGREIQYNEEIWIAEESIPIRSRPLDEPARLLVELRAVSPLEPGMYAIHWGALEGYDSVESRLFLFSLEAPNEGPDEASEGEGEDEADDADQAAE